MGYPIPHVIFSVQTCLNNTYLHEMAWHLSTISHQSQACSDKYNQIQGTSPCLQFSTPSTCLASDLAALTAFQKDPKGISSNSINPHVLPTYHRKKSPIFQRFFVCPPPLRVFVRRKRVHRSSDPKALQLPVGNLQRSSALFAGELLRILEPNLFDFFPLKSWMLLSEMFLAKSSEILEYSLKLQFDILAPSREYLNENLFTALHVELSIFLAR